MPYAERFRNPTRAFSPRQLPTDRDHAVPSANIRVINRRVCSWAVAGPAVQHETHSRLTSGNVFPLRRPSTSAGAPERCSQSRVRFVAPNNGAPWTAARRSGRMDIATGGSGGNTARGLRQKAKSRLASCGGEPARFKTRQARWGLDKVVPYRGFVDNSFCNLCLSNVGSTTSVFRRWFPLRSYRNSRSSSKPSPA